MWSADHVAASLEGFFWPKILFDFWTKLLDPAVKPLPILQTINIGIALINLAYEWPLNVLAGTAIHPSIEVRLFWLPLASLSSVLLYQGSDPALYYMIATAVYFWAFTEGEVICAEPWTLPKRRIEKV
ncbi:hypothetical protein ANO11243_054310 [Dothideomycetidae sp. 11243]|nr:hypothetical protein ANO11243_054310 [fungal sp. No.11243]